MTTTGRPAWTNLELFVPVHPHGLAKTSEKKFWLLSQTPGHPANNIIALTPSMDAAQLGISSMLKELQTPRKRDCSGSRKPTPKSQFDKNG